MVFIPALTVVILLVIFPRSNLASFPKVFPETSLIVAIFARCFGGLEQILDFDDEGKIRHRVAL